MAGKLSTLRPWAPYHDWCKSKFITKTGLNHLCRSEYLATSTLLDPHRLMNTIHALKLYSTHHNLAVRLWIGSKTKGALNPSNLYRSTTLILVPNNARPPATASQAFVFWSGVTFPAKSGGSWPWTTRRDEMRGNSCGWVHCRSLEIVCSSYIVFFWVYLTQCGVKMSLTLNEPI